MRGIKPITILLPGGQYIAKKVVCKANQVQPFRLVGGGGGSLSEGILSFVEYAPRLLIVLPSRQFLLPKPELGVILQELTPCKITDTLIQ